ncbi:deoxyribose-phosphate aldolase [Herbivorax sp. ANBcel31]|uniref:deoxyribose-phosphate aldolase n=1 Tax=Herbivorax sp. ANBcel31 TaxID=3069754 RepID=UPI0027B2977A|nr:deoxyribose-phosphate aldolase [Herbivorax sp. ANBcel31]MDQ2085354.1 deoxyribose-phosphate aldolase [Herbivorax sp. ANBcel31]
MDKRDVVAKAIDHAVLKPEFTDLELEKEVKLAKEYNVASVCVKPCHVKIAGEILKDSKVLVGTVIGFPHGTTTTKCKVNESIEAIENGAKELDMVINIGKLISGDYQYLKNDISEVVNCAHDRNVIVKVIIETALLNDQQKIQACEIAEQAGADFVKTSTGFNGGGASLSDIELMKESVSSKTKIKASGGIKTLEQAMKFIEVGCSRLGTSSTVAILTNSVNDVDSNY